MERRFGRAISGRDRQRYESQARRNVDNGGVRLPLQMRQKCCRQPNRAEQISRNNRFGGVQAGRQSLEVFYLHDPGVVDQHVEAGILSGDLLCQSSDSFGIVDVERQGDDSGVRFDSVVQDVLPASGDYYLVTELMEGFSQAASYTGTTAGDENSITRELHAVMYPSATMLSTETCCKSASPWYNVPVAHYYFASLSSR